MSRPSIFVVSAFATAAAIAAAVGYEWLPKAALNAWPLAVGTIGLALTQRVEAPRRGVYLGLIVAAFVLELVGAELPIAPIALGIARIALLALVLLTLYRRPIDEIGATTDGVNWRTISFGAVVGLLPTAGPWLAVWVTRPAALVLNPEWRYADEPLWGAIAALVGAGAILFVNTVVGEEAGWRGYLVRELRGRTTRRRLVWGTALVFALWHIPFDIFIGDMDAPNLVVNQFSRYTMGLVYVHVFIRTGGSLIPVSVAHAMHNFVLYQLIAPRGLLAPEPAGLEGLAVAGGYLLMAVALVFVVGRQARAIYPEWTAPRPGPLTPPSGTESAGSEPRA